MKDFLLFRLFWRVSPLMSSPVRSPLAFSRFEFKAGARFFVGALVATATFMGMAASGEAAESPPVVTTHTRATLVTSSAPDRSRDRNAPLMAGLRLQLAPGWHTYWRNPGDAGDPARVTLTARDASGKEVFKAGPILWPVPERLKEGGLMAYAYTGDVLLPFQLVPVARDARKGNGDGNENEPVTLKAHAEWLVCATLCVPEEGDFTLVLPPAGEEVASKQTHQANQELLFKNALAHLPEKFTGQAALSPDGVLTLSDNSSDNLNLSTVRDAWFMPFEPGLIDQDTPQKIERTPGKLSLRLTPDRQTKPPFWTEPLRGIVVVENARESDRGNGSRTQRAFAVTAVPTASSVAAVPQATANQATINQPTVKETSVKETGPKELGASSSVLRLALFAFLGGLVLNLMPCVFPVLAMKALSLARMGGAARRERLESGLFYTLGVTVSFMALGGLLAALRSMGAAAGWGFQFQSPAFVIGVGWVLFLLALNLLGVFQITGGKAAGAAAVLPRHGRIGDFLTGLLAVVVATPCTAPFMGVAIAGALAASPLETLAIFAAMGLGLAAPYALLAALPGLASRLPKAGSWMETFKQALAFPLLAACAWLLWVAALQQGGAGVAVGAGGAVLLGLAAWLWGGAQKRAMTDGGVGVTRFCRVLALFCFLACAFGLARFAYTSASRAEGQAALENGLSSGGEASGREASVIEPFSETRLAALRAEGRPVLVDMTAAWCLTCLVNDRVALDTAQVQAAFRAHHAVLLRGDWTNRNGVLTAYLHAHGRQGVPLYVYYPPASPPTERILPQILTPSLVINALNTP